MHGDITTRVMSGLGIAALATLSLFTGNTVSQIADTDLSNKANQQSSKQQMACHTTGHRYCGTAVGGVRG